MEKLRLGIVGIGKISEIYLRNITEHYSDRLEAAAVSDIVSERAEQAAGQFGIPQVMDFDEMLADDSIDIILNLTTPEHHYPVSLQVLQAKKHVYMEKPISLRREDAEHLLKTAEAGSVRIGTAPDTFLGSGLQTCRTLIDDGWIGEPAAFFACMMNHGPERWHPNPGFYYAFGGGPMLDMGPYYLTALVHLLGPIRQVSGFSKITSPQRTITSEPLKGRKIPVEIPTHYSGALEFADGTVGNISMSFDVWTHSLPAIEIYGTEGTLKVPDPNFFCGPVYLRRAGDEAWTEMPLLYPYAENSRGLGLYDMADAICRGEKHRASGELGAHVLDAMLGFSDSAESGKQYRMKGTCTRPEPFQMLSKQS